VTGVDEYRSDLEIVRFTLRLECVQEDFYDRRPRRRRCPSGHALFARQNVPPARASESRALRSLAAVIAADGLPSLGGGAGTGGDTRI